ncbi:MAG: hypothetical protein GTN62_01595 [Gemmatimonadales bacterium]|nr:hypothetical protein [Gemmatimonadales bacterium]NIN48796.1 hypothetical protein [Gemmatimonadales bacterium]NIP06260.1 hypothetical protein [Gemmatimonadales bacterium]NIR00147.1 hypothetical protein [Gemmatimonadales bacterium]NIS64550.1 hypothetical protein [Gemmatimonadales bacterium]
MTAIVLLVLLQTSTWAVSPDRVTVGDTVRLVRRITTAPDVQARLQPLVASVAVEPLSAPRAAWAEGTLTILYTVALFDSGRQAVAMPPSELLYPDGRVETLAGDTAWVNVVSVLPVQDTLPSPMPSLEPIARELTRTAPLVGLVLAVIGATVVWGFARRRTRPRPGAADEEVEAVGPAVDRWVSAGESRAVAAVTADRLRERVAALLPDAGRHLDTEECVEVLRRVDPGWPVRELTDILRALERARFSPAVPSDVLEVVDQADNLMERLVAPAVEVDE